MIFYDQMSGEEYKGLKSNTGIIKILDRYNKNAQYFKIRGRSIELSVEDISLTFGLSALGIDLLLNRKCNKKRVFLKHYFGDNKSVTRGSIEKAINILLSAKDHRTL